MKCKFHRPASITHLVMCNTKQIKSFCVFKIFMTRNQKTHIMLNENKTHIMLNEKNANALHDNTQLSYREYINKKYQFLNQPTSTCTN